MEEKKMPFFVRVKNAVINFDEYKTFSEEKTSTSIKYMLKLAIIFTIIIVISLTWQIIQETNNLITDFKNEWPEFSFQDNVLVIEGETKRIIKGDEDGYFGFIMDSEEDALSNINESGDYQRVIAILKDKIIIRNVENIESSITYEQLSQKYDINNINKNNIIQFLSRK